jgi:transcriptional regulator with XRE-family HTH domain
VLTTGSQLAAARTLIGMDQREVAKAAGLSATTIRNMEAARGRPIGGRPHNVQAVQRVLEEAGILFLGEEASGGVGVRMRKVPS